MTSPLRRFAAWLLRFCHRFSPPSVRDWAEAMLGELEFVEGDWPALAWAAGGAGVLMKRTLIQFVTGRSESAATAGGPAHRVPVLGGGPMRKLTSGIALLGVSVLAVLMFAPSFQQALEVSGGSWRTIFEWPPLTERSAHKLVAVARAERDGETLAFVALETPSGAESVNLANEAVALDPKLTWVYFMLACRDWRNPEAANWAERLAKWDPDNAVPQLVRGQLEALRVSNGEVVAADAAKLRADSRWMNAMAAGFTAKKYDSYLAARLDLDRAVMARRHLSDPLLLLNGISWQPLPNFIMIKSFADVLYDQGKAYETRRDPDAASRDYWTVARLGQMMYLHSQTDIERIIGAILQREAYQRLTKLAQRAGDRDLTDLFAYQIQSLDPRRIAVNDYGSDIAVYQWNAAAVQVAVAALLVCAVLLLVWIVDLFVTRGTKSKAGRLASCLRASGIVGSCGLLAASVALYISYHPYAELFARFVHGRGAEHASSLMAFWGFADFGWTVGRFFSQGFGWLALLVLAACLLVFEVYRFFSSRGPAHEAV